MKAIYVLIIASTILNIIAPDAPLWSWEYWIPKGLSLIMILTATGIGAYSLYKECRAKTDNDA